MSLADKFHRPKVSFTRFFDFESVRRRLKAPAIFVGATLVVMTLALIFAAGFHIMSIWAALIVVVWLFIAGAGKVSED